MGEDLSRDLYYLVSGDDRAAGVVVLEAPQGRWAPLFTTREGAAALARKAPAGVRVARAAARDPRAREELLLACLDSGAEVLAIDPASGTAAVGAPERASSVRAALASVRSHRTGTACL